MMPPHVGILLISTVLALVPFIVSATKRRLDFLTPAGIFALGFSASYAFKGWLVLVDPVNFVTYKEKFFVREDALFGAMILSWLALIMFYIGYYGAELLRRNTFPRLVLTRTTSKAAQYASSIAVLLAVASVVALFAATRSTIGAFSVTADFANRLRNAFMRAWSEHPLYFHFP